MKMNKINKWLIEILIIVVSLAIISLAIGFFSLLGYLESFRIVFGSIYVLFLPGFIISYIFFPRTKEFDSNTNSREDTSKKPLGVVDIDWIERIALSFALSIAIVPLTVFYLNLVGIKINLLNSSLIILGIIIISLIIILYKSKEKRYF